MRLGAARVETDEKQSAFRSNCCDRRFDEIRLLMNPIAWQIFSARRQRHRQSDTIVSKRATTLPIRVLLTFCFLLLLIAVVQFLPLDETIAER